MLWIHIGMPKAGSSSLQAYLNANGDLLSRHNIMYMKTGRHEEEERKVPLVSHNTLAKQMRENWKNVEENLFNRYLNEYNENRSKECIISAEMFFGHRLAPLKEKLTDHIDDPINIVIYLRRFSDFLESDYKQRAKKARQFTNAHRYAKNALKFAKTDESYLNFSAMFEEIKSDIPNAVIHPRIFLKEDMTGGDIISDFLTNLEVPIDEIVLPESPINRSLSRVSSEALGLFAAKGSGINNRLHQRLDSALQNAEDGKFFAKGDVLLPDEANELNEVLEEKNKAVLQEYFPDRKRLFPSVEHNKGFPLRGDTTELDRLKETVREILKIQHRFRKGS
ncbi:hypothetical protein Q0601_14995 [Paracoccus onubensis]|uniref:hypothetical protein n=1 Tax=Paracoccus onubensis TaxID=1675788 RepID=UPI002731D635|nr:hypothetical protein [Paracoccus onubensis]MDP0928491.1 hypothetical protein [Paracoccus onubensis]